jgi:hypothetical protein
MRSSGAAYQISEASGAGSKREAKHEVRFQQNNERSEAALRF